MTDNSDVKALIGEASATVALREEGGELSSARAERYPGYGSWELSAPQSALTQYLWLIRKRAPLVMLIVISFIIMGAVVTMLSTKRYTARETLQIDRTVPKVVEGGNVTPTETLDIDFLKTQYEILQSRAVAVRVASRLQLADDVDFVQRKSFLSPLWRLFGSKTPVAESNEARERRAVDLVLGDRVVRPISGSRLVEVNFTDTNPVRAQKITRELADAFIASNMDKRFEANSFASAFLEDQLKVLQVKLQDAERALVAFGEQDQIVNTTDKSSIAEENLSAANVALGKLVADRIRAEQLFRQADKGDITSLQQVLDSKVIEDLRTTRSKLMTQYSEKLQLFKPTYPEMIQIDNQIKEVDRRVIFESKKIVAALKSTFDSSVAQEGAMQSRIDELKSAVLELQKRNIKYNTLKREADVNRSLYENILQRSKEVSIASGVSANNIFIVDKAEVPYDPSSPRIALNMMLALFLGLACGIGAAITMEWLDDTIRSAEDLERFTGLPTLGVIPKLSDGSPVDDALATVHSQVSEAYRSLCTSISFATDQGLPKSIFVTSGSSSEGKTTSSIAIARHFAATGLKVLLIDGDLRKPSIHTRMEVSNAVGLSSYLSGTCSPPAALQTTSTPNLTLMPSGPVPPNPAGLLGSPRMLSLISVGSEVFDLIVVDGAPILGLADSILLTNVTAITLFVAAAGTSRKFTVLNALRRLRHARAPVIGSILTMHNYRMSSYYEAYGYGNNYAYGVPQDETQVTHDEPLKVLASKG